MEPVLLLVMVLAQYPHFHVVISYCEIDSRLNLSTYLRNAINPRTIYPYSHYTVLSKYVHTLLFYQLQRIESTISYLYLYLY